MSANRVCAIVCLGVEGLTRLSLVVPFPLAAGALTNSATQKVDKSTDFVFGHLCLQTEFAP